MLPYRCLMEAESIWALLLKTFHLRPQQHMHLHHVVSAQVWHTIPLPSPHNPPQHVTPPPLSPNL